MVTASSSDIDDYITFSRDLLASVSNKEEPISVSLLHIWQVIIGWISTLKNEFILSSSVVLVHSGYWKHSISTPEVFGHNVIKVGNIFCLCRLLNMLEYLFSPNLEVSSLNTLSYRFGISGKCQLENRRQLQCFVSGRASCPKSFLRGSDTAWTLGCAVVLIPEENSLCGLA